MKKKPHLKFYMDCMEAGVMPGGGLCACVENGYLKEGLFRLLEPTSDEIPKGNDYAFWGGGKDRISDFKRFTPLRQNIVLLMAAMNNEL